MKVKFGRMDRALLCADLALGDLLNSMQGDV